MSTERDLEQWAKARAAELGNRTCHEHNWNGRLMWMCVDCVAAALCEVAERRCMDHSDCSWKGCAFVIELETKLAAALRELAEARTKLGVADEMIDEIMASHNDPDSPDYNECEKDPCAWCAQWLAAQGKP
jgi:hypothetical protein